MALPDIQEAQALLARDAAAEAVQVLENLVALYPRYAAAHVLLARAYEAAEDWQQAMGTWQEVGLLVPESDAVHAGLQRVIRATRTASSSAAPAEAPGASPFLEFDDPVDAEGEAPEASDAAEAPEDEAAQIDEAPPAGEPAAEEAPPAVEPESVASPPAEEAAPVAAEAATEEELGREDPVDERTIEAPEGAPDEIAGLEAAPDPEEETPDAEAAPDAEAKGTAGDAPAWLHGLDDYTPSFHRGEDAAADEGSDRPRPPQAEHEPRQQAGDGSSIAPQPDLAEFDDLDRLIDELEGARIVPRPDFESIPPPDLDDEIDDMVSETLARIYATQRQYADAARVYEALARQQPDRADEFLEQAARMRSRAEES